MISPLTLTEGVLALLLSPFRVRVCARVRACSCLFVGDRSLRDVVVVAVHRLTVRGSMGAWETWVCRVLFKSSSALLKFSLTRKVVITLASKATLSLGR